jgi:hypothetical protein
MDPGPEALPTHEDLRKRAIQWLTNNRHCGVVISEIVTGCSEIPDAIGWRGHASYLVECKVSRADFHAQKKKIHARTGRGVGQFRYILCPKGVLRPEDLDGTDYGLLAWLPFLAGAGGSVRVLKEATPRESCQDDEITMLVSALRRVREREFLILVREPASA